MTQTRKTQPAPSTPQDLVDDARHTLAEWDFSPVSRPVVVGYEGRRTIVLDDDSRLNVRAYVGDGLADWERELLANLGTPVEPAQMVELHVRNVNDDSGRGARVHLNVSEMAALHSALGVVLDARG